MNKIKARSRLVCGACVIIASVCNPAQAQTAAHDRPMSAMDLEAMVIDCQHKEAQMRLLNSLRPSRDDRIWAGMSNLFSPWRAWTDQETFYHNQEIKSGRYQWIINQKILQLKQNCM